jgi:hypothetical protein
LNQRRDHFLAPGVFLKCRSWNSFAFTCKASSSIRLSQPSLILLSEQLLDVLHSSALCDWSSRFSFAHSSRISLTAALSLLIYSLSYPDFFLRVAYLLAAPVWFLPPLWLWDKISLPRLSSFFPARQLPSSLALLPVQLAQPQRRYFSLHLSCACSDPSAALLSPMLRAARSAPCTPRLPSSRRLLGPTPPWVPWCRVRLPAQHAAPSPGVPTRSLSARPWNSSRSVLSISVTCVSSPDLQLHNLQLYICHSPVSSSRPVNHVLLCSISSNHESRTLDKNKRGPCASLIKYSVEDFNRRSSSFRASSRNPKDRMKTKLAARYSPSARQIVWIGKSLPISWIRVSCGNGKLINYLE